MYTSILHGARVLLHDFEHGESWARQRQYGPSFAKKLTDKLRKLEAAPTAFHNEYMSREFSSIKKSYQEGALLAELESFAHLEEPIESVVQAMAKMNEHKNLDDNQTSDSEGNEAD